MSAAPSLGEDLALALELADLADQLTLARYRATDLQVETKPDLTPVSEADRRVEEAIREHVSRRKSGDAVVGEEFGGEQETSGAPRRWILDPIDGTKSYIRGLPTWSTLIALEIEGEAAVGVCSAPALGRRWWASRGHGALADGRPIQVSGVNQLSAAQLTWGGIEDWDAMGELDALLELGRSCWRTRGIGDAWQYMLVAEGVAEVALDPQVSLWDLAAPKVIVEEAGGRFSDFGGRPTAAGGSGLATNGHVHEAVLAVIGR